MSDYWRKNYKSFLVVLLISLSFVSTVSAQSLGTADNPPRLRELEALAVQLVYFIWGVSALIFTVLLMIIGARYMLSAGDQQKQQDIKDKGTKWVYGLILVFISYPIVLTFYKVTGIGNNSTCYADIKSPGFHFFFPKICTDPTAESGHSYGSACSPGDDLGSSDKCCYGSVIMPTGVGVKIVTSSNRVYTFNTGSASICNPVGSSCVAGTSGCSCSYTYDSNQKDQAKKFVSGCK